MHFLASLLRLSFDLIAFFQDIKVSILSACHLHPQMVLLLKFMTSFFGKSNIPLNKHGGVYGMRRFGLMVKHHSF